MNLRIQRCALLTATLFAVSCAQDPVEEPTDDVSEDDELVPGQAVIEDGGAAVVVPPAGTGVITEAIFVDGRTKVLQVETGLDGHPTLIDQDLWEPEGAERAACVKPPACDDAASNLLGFKWTQTYHWYFNGASTPGEITAANAETQLINAVVNITRSDNPCGFADQVSATSNHRGRTSRGANITAAGACGTRDSVNVVSFGDLPNGVLGVACTWYSGGSAVESDIKFNKVDHNWFTGAVPGNCGSNRFSLQAVATHEFGHTFGLAHVGECAHGNLTMSTQIDACSNAASSLGRGDVRGLRALY